MPRDPKNPRALPDQSEWTFDLIEQAHEEIRPPVRDHRVAEFREERGRVWEAVTDPFAQICGSRLRCPAEVLGKVGQSRNKCLGEGEDIDLFRDPAPA